MTNERDGVAGQNLAAIPSDAARQLAALAVQVRLPLLDLIANPDVPGGKLSAAKVAFEKYATEACRIIDGLRARAVHSEQARPEVQSAAVPEPETPTDALLPVDIERAIQAFGSAMWKRGEAWGLDWAPGTEGEQQWKDSDEASTRARAELRQAIGATLRPPSAGRVREENHKETEVTIPAESIENNTATSIIAGPPPFVEFPSISRLTRDIVVTEKIDGTNAQVHITETGQVFAGSRSRWITPEADNFGFARWVKDHEDELRALGPGSHFGEWWGSGIQRGYGFEKGIKRFSLFNVGRWTSDRNELAQTSLPTPELSTACREVPCCHVVPVLLRWQFDTSRIDGALQGLASAGSVAAPGFMKPEGIVVYHAHSRTLFKKTLEKNDGHKSAS